MNTDEHRLQKRDELELRGSGSDGISEKILGCGSLEEVFWDALADSLYHVLSVFIGVQQKRCLPRQSVSATDEHG